MDFILPPQLTNAQGELRKIGFELEFGNAGLEEVAALIVNLYGGEIVMENKFLQKVKGTRLGDFGLKMDSRVLTEKRYEGFFETLGIDPGSERVENLMEDLAAWWVPYEIGAPPVSIKEMAELEALRAGLHDLNATGTRASLIKAYATHINPELPSQDAECLLRYLKAFLLLYPWLFKEAHVAIARRMSAFIRPFPEEYIHFVLQPEYKPNLEKFLADYHAANPDRNRPLDLYPILAHLMPEAVIKLGDLGNVKPRPTLHYRLPNSQVDEAGWTLAYEWNHWVAVEILAYNENELKAMCADYLQMAEEDKNNKRWIAYTEDWVRKHVQ